MASPVFAFVLRLLPLAAWPEKNQDHFWGVYIVMGYVEGKYVNQRSYLYLQIIYIN